jgi:hypothetical protein
VHDFDIEALYRGETRSCARRRVQRRGADAKLRHGGCAAGEFFNIGDDQFVKDGDTKEIEFPICINQEGISGRFTPGARFTTSIFLRDIEGAGAPLFGVFEDGTPSDNWTTVSFPAARLRTLTVTLSTVVVHDDMDSISVGDWHVFFNVANFAGDTAPRYGRRRRAFVFDFRGGPKCFDR